MTQARIYQPSKAAMQSGRAQTHSWLLEYEPATRRDPDPLMGWSSALDTLNEVQLRFPTLNKAVALAETHALDYTICARRRSAKAMPRTSATSAIDVTVTEARLGGIVH